MAKMYRYTVSGNLEFPIDMLRYDCCWPDTQEAVAKIDETRSRFERTLKAPFKIDLMGCGTPTVPRWISFGWRVSNIRAA